MTRRYVLTRYFAGATMARVGDEMSGPALMLAGYAVAGSASEAAALLASITAAAAAGGPVLGAVLDRQRRPGRLLAESRTISGYQPYVGQMNINMSKP
ncbi:hypothetical protein ACWDZ8_46245, partial [Streptomyces sp. NPDC003233]